MKRAETLDEVVLRVIREASYDGVPEEDLPDAVGFWVEASEVAIGRALGRLFLAGVITRETTSHPWVLVQS